MKQQIMPTIEARIPFLMKSRPSDGPTVRSSRMIISAGSAPERSTSERASAFSGVKFPSMMPLSLIWLLMFGADWTRLSSTIARRLLMFSPVTFANFTAPAAFRKNMTAGWLNLSRSTRAFFMSRPVTAAARLSTYQTGVRVRASASSLKPSTISRSSGTVPPYAPRAASIVGNGPPRSSTSLSSRRPVVPMISLTRLGSSTPGISTTMRSVPCRWMTGSATPRASTRLRIVSTAWRVAWSSIVIRSESLKEIFHSRPRWSMDHAFGGRTAVTRSLSFAASVFSSIASVKPVPSAGPAGITDTPRLPPSSLSRSSVSWASTRSASVVFTCMTRWMPPRRSSPSLRPFLRTSEIVGVGGAVGDFFSASWPRHQYALTEPRRTANVTPTRHPVGLFTNATSGRGPVRKAARSHPFVRETAGCARLLRANRRSLAEPLLLRTRQMLGGQPRGIRGQRDAGQPLGDVGRERRQKPLVPPGVTRHDEHRALAEDVRGEEAHHGEEALVVRAGERPVEEKRHARHPRAEVPQGREARRQVQLLARAGRKARLNLALRRDASPAHERRKGEIVAELQRLVWRLPGCENLLRGRLQPAAEVAIHGLSLIHI